MCITESLCCIPETNTTLYINYTPIKKKREREREIWASVALRFAHEMYFRVCLVNMIQKSHAS